MNGPALPTQAAGFGAGCELPDEPTIAIPGEFGVRLEDCLVIAVDGARCFTEQRPSVEKIVPD